MGNEIWVWFLCGLDWMRDVIGAEVSVVLFIQKRWQGDGGVVFL